MAIKTDSELKGFFESRDKPNQSQFSDLIDSKRSKLDNIDYDDLTDYVKALFNAAFNRTVILPSGTFSYNAPAGTLIEGFFIGDRPNFHIATDITYLTRIGTTPGGNEIFDDTLVDTTNDPQSGILFSKYYCLTDKTIYITTTPVAGEPNNPLIKIYKS